MRLSKDFKEFIELLNAHDVRYLVVGGHAVAAHGHPRNTKDMDVWVWRDHANIKKFFTALTEFGFGNIGLTIEDFLFHDNIIQLGFPPNRIDILTELSGVSFEKCFQRKVVFDVQGIPCNVIGLEDLKRTKKATGRTQDLADLENLE